MQNDHLTTKILKEFNATVKNVYTWMDLGSIDKQMVNKYNPTPKTNEYD